MKDYLIKKTKEIVSKWVWLPEKRKRVTHKIPVYGNLVVPFEMTIPVKGKRDYRKILGFLLEVLDKL